jgi:putative nucleotidyltransferase with HDIG domain
VASMEYGMPPMAGWGMGLDRFFALLEGEENLRDTILFPTMRPRDGQKRPAKKTGAKELDLGLDRKKAGELLDKYVADRNTRAHLLETEAIMRGLAGHFGEDEEKWGIIGLLHDIDWDLTKDDLPNHTVKSVEILKEAGASDFLIETVVSHCYGSETCGEHRNKKRESRLEHCLAAAENLTGLIVASALMQPDKKLSSVKLSSLKKKFKTKGFAANCNREIMMECEQAGLTLDEFLEIGLRSMQDIADEIGL